MTKSKLEQLASLKGSKPKTVNNNYIIQNLLFKYFTLFNYEIKTYKVLEPYKNMRNEPSRSSVMAIKNFNAGYEEDDSDIELGEDDVNEEE